MQSDSEALVVSAFGRGHWVAAALVQQGISTTLMDVSDQMGNWSPEDWEGPYGYFRSEDLDSVQLEMMNEGDALVLNPQGFTVWLADGPMEFKGILSNYRKTNDAWLKSFLQSFAASEYIDRGDAKENRWSLPVSSDFYIRYASRHGLQKSLQWCQQRGVKCLTKVNIVDLSLSDRKTLSGIEYKTDRPGVLKAAQFVWCLSGEETGMLNAKIREKLFPKGNLEMTWSWLRYRIRMDASPLRDRLPPYVVILSDVHLPWSHENSMVLQRTSSADLFDLWMVLPTVQRFNKQYLQEKAQRAKDVLSAKLPGVSLLVQDYPQEHSYTYNQLGPSRFGYFDAHHSADVKNNSMSNVDMVGPEYWTSGVHQGNFAPQKAALNRIKNWWNHKEELRRKREEKLKKAGRAK